MKIFLKYAFSTFLVLILLLSVCIPAFAGDGKWVKDGENRKYMVEDRFYVSDYWLIDGDWYYFDDDCNMITGWYKKGNAWRYFGEDGKMRTGWLLDKNNWYYLYENERPFNGGGKMQTGWQYIKGKWYFFASNGILQPDNEKSGKWIKSGSKWWYKHTDGSYTKNAWEKINNKWYHFDEKGWMQFGWLKLNNKWYYLGGANDGVMKMGWLKYKDKWYYLDNDGVMKSGWVEYNSNWYYLGDADDGVMKTGWVNTTNRISNPYSQYTQSGSENKYWYYLDESGKMLDGWQTIKGKTYLFLSGIMSTGFHWYPPHGDYVQAYFFDPDGSMVKNAWRKREIKNQGYEKWFYFGPDGKALLNQFVGEYFVNANGEWDEEFEPLEITKEVKSIDFKGYSYFFNETVNDFDRVELEAKTIEDAEAINGFVGFVNSLEMKNVDCISGWVMEGNKYIITVNYSDETSELFAVSCNDSIFANKSAFYNMDSDYINDLYNAY